MYNNNNKMYNKKKLKKVEHMYYHNLLHVPILNYYNKIIKIKENIKYVFNI